MPRSPLRFLAPLALLLPLAVPVLADDHSADVLDADGVTFMNDAAGGMLAHEFGHSLIRDALVRDGQFMVLGNEETAVDNFVPILLFQDSDQVHGTERAMMLTDHALSWLYAAKEYADRLSLEGLSYYDEHDTDIRRAYTMMCLMVGGSKPAFQDMANAWGMPDERQNDCQMTFTNTQSAWNKFLEPAARGDEPTPVKVTYEDTTDYAPYREAMMQSHLLEIIAGMVTYHYQLRPGTEITARDCGGQGDGKSEGLKIEICYERVQFYYYLWDKFGRDDTSRSLVKADDYFGDSTASGEDDILKDIIPETGDDPAGDDSATDSSE